MLLNKLSFILTSKEKNQGYILIVFSLFAGALEIIGVSLIIPIVNFYSNDYNLNFFDSFTFFDLKNNVKIIVIIFFFLLIFKNIFIFYIKYLINKYCANLHVNLSYRMFKSYLNKEYKFHILNNSATLHRNVYDSSISIISVVRSILNIILDLFLLILLTLFLLYTNFFLSSILLILCGISFFILNYSIGKFSAEIGSKRHNNVQYILKYLMQGFASIKELKFLKSEKNFLSKFQDQMREYAGNDKKFNTIITLPRYLLEIILIFLVAIFLSVNSNEYFKANLPFLILVVYASLRLFPIVNRLISNFSTITYRHKALEDIYEEQLKSVDNGFKSDEIPNNFDDDLSIENIEIKNLNFKYDNSDQLILKDINVKINKNDKIIIYGKSGSGKSTFVDIILGLLEPTSGEIIINNQKKDIFKKIWHKKIAYVPQNPNFIDDTIVQNVALGELSGEIDNDKVIDSLKRALVYDDIIKYHKNVNANMGERGLKLSGGQKQRIAIARALYKGVDFIIFDESTNNLDEENENKMINDILKLNKTIIFISHNEKIRKFFNKSLQLKSK